jgi:ADP-heptose:LPS heptosyltransferase
VNLNLKLKLDLILGTVLAVVLKPSAYMLGLLLKRNHNLIPQKEIVFIKMLGGGSILLALPAILGIKKKYPEVKLTLYTTPAVSKFAEVLNVFDRILVVQEDSLFNLLKSGTSNLWKVLRADTVVDLEVYSLLSTALSVFTLARNRIGFYYSTTFRRKELHTHLIFLNRSSGIYYFYEEVTWLMGAKPATMAECEEWFRSHFHNSAMETDKGVTKIAVNHACSDMGRERMLSVEQWVEIFQKRGLTNEHVYFLGIKKDAMMAQQIVDKLQLRFPQAKFFNKCGAHELKETLTLLKECQEFYGIDSALLHFARLLRLKCTSYWGPTDPATRLKPIEGLDETVYYNKIPCSPCIHITGYPPCHGNNLCMKNIFIKNDERVPMPMIRPHTKNDL